MPCSITQLGTLSHVAEKYVAHAAVYATVVYQQIALEIILETTEIKVGGTGCHDILVDNHALGMQHAGIIQIYLYAGFEALRYITV